MYPVLWEPFGFSISTFGVMMALGFLASSWIVGLRLRERGLDPELSSTILIYAVVGGVAGAKLYFVIDTLAREGGSAWELLTDRAGLTWFGGLIGGTLGVVAGSRLHRIPTAVVADGVANAAPFGQALGRVGCFLVGDDYGRETDGWWGVAFPKGAPPTLAPVHPTQLYEVAWLLAAGLLLWKRRRSSPFLFGEYLALAGIGRFAIELLRVNPRVALGLSEAQWISIALLVIGSAGWLYMRFRPDAGAAAAGAARRPSGPVRRPRDP